METILFAAGAYIIGSFPTALVIGLKYFKKDIRKEGSGNLGGTNAGRVLGKNTGLIVSAIDILKVMIPTLLARIYFGIDMAAIIGICAMLGHCFPLFAGFRGGKGVSSFLGIGIVINPYVSAGIFAFWFILRYITNYVSVSSMIACFSAAIAMYFVYGPHTVFYVMLIGSLFIVFLHRANIQRLLKGTENKIRKR